MQKFDVNNPNLKYATPSEEGRATAIDNMKFGLVVSEICEWADKSQYFAPLPGGGGEVIAPFCGGHSRRYYENTEDAVTV